MGSCELHPEAEDSPDHSDFDLLAWVDEGRSKELNHLASWEGAWAWEGSSRHQVADKSRLKPGLH